MPGIFVSHAAVDKPLADRFVNTILRLGCQIPIDRIFYTSGSATGVPGGANLNEHVRTRLADADLSVALITRSYLRRPFCLAELGAAWSRVPTLLPILEPGLSHSDLDGVIAGLFVLRMDDEASLDVVHDRVRDTVGVAADTRALNDARVWNEQRKAWLEFVDGWTSSGGSDPPVSVTSCSRNADHLEVFWTDRSGSVGYRWWLDDFGWSDVLHWDEPRANHLAAVSRRPDDQWLFGVFETGQVWGRRWVLRDDGAMVAGKPEWINGVVSGPLSASSKGPEHLELFAHWPSGEPCHLTREHGGWTEWTSDWWRP